MTDDAPKPLTETTITEPAETLAPKPGVTPAETAHHATPAAAETANRTPLIAVVALAVLVVVGGYLIWQQAANASLQAGQAQAKLDAISQRTDALEARPAAPPPPDLRPLQQQMQALQQRIDALEKKPAPTAQLDQAGQQQLATLSGRIDGIGARQNQLGKQEQSDVDAIKQQLASLDSRLTEAAKAQTQINAINTRDARLAQLQAATAALNTGRPLGAIDGAPPALAQFAAKPPPTEASLRLSFDQAANAARQAGQPAQENAPFLSRLWDRAQSGVVVRDGDRVIVGDAVSGILEHAKLLLNAGDIAGAVKVLDGLAGPAAQAMAPWKAQAQSLVDARAALISAAHS